MAENGKMKKDKLELWKKRLEESDSGFRSELEKMDQRERLYNGEPEQKNLVPGDVKRDDNDKHINHVRNIIFENIESQISSGIPQPKVTARKKEDEHLADMIENFLRNELDRLPFEEMNDMAERTVPIQGAVGFLVEWDNGKKTHSTVGELSVSVIHPKQFGPQPGVFTGLDDMDYFILKIPTTKEAVRNKYHKSVYAETESEPQVRSYDGAEQETDAVTLYVGYAKNAGGGIDKYAWVNDVELEDLENYQSRRLPVCACCGKVRPLQGERVMGDFLREGEPYDGGACPYCGSKEFEDRRQDYEEIPIPVLNRVFAGGQAETVGGTMAETVYMTAKVPFYTPDCFPIIMQRSVSVYGKLLGNSDVDVIRDQQAVVNRLEQKMLDRMLEAGSRITLPDNRADLGLDGEDGKIWRVSAAEKQCIDTYEFSGNLQYEMAFLGQAYEESRQILGITDSFQGRRDPTATSGVAKQASAARAAGRMESKRIMKNAAYARLFETMFKFWLAYSDEPRTVSYKNYRGETEYGQISRYDFLRQDETGQYYWDDNFLFSCDTSAPLASDRETMWQETRMNLQTGAFGDPSDPETLILFWGKMESLHYPGAGETKSYLEDKLRQQQANRMFEAMQMPGREMAEEAPGSGITYPAEPAAMEAQEPAIY